MALPFKYLPPIAGGAVLVAWLAPPHFLVLYDLALIRYLGLGQWSLGGVSVATDDIVFGLLVVLIVVRGIPVPRIPYFYVWATVGVIMTINYVVTPETSRHLTDPIRVVYQLYRYCWKPLLYYPICIIFLRTWSQASMALYAYIFGSMICSFETIKQAYAGVTNPAGPFNHGNALGAVIVMPMIYVTASVIVPKSRAAWYVSLLSLLVFARALLACASRGGMVAYFGGACMLAGLLFFLDRGRRGVGKMILVGSLGLIALLIMVPDLLERSSIKHALSSTGGSNEETMDWRIRQRWPHFFKKSLEHPFIGSGTHVDLSLGDAANTPHNGYLALSSRYGFGVPIIYIFFYLLLVRNCLMDFIRIKDTETRIFPLALLCGTTAYMVHNMIESNFVIPFMLKFFWMNAAICISRAYMVAPPSMVRAVRLRQALARHKAQTEATTA